MKKDTIKKMVCAASIVGIALFTMGCDDDEHRHARRPHHYPPPPPQHQPRHTPPPKHDGRKPPPKHDDKKPHKRSAVIDMAGEYKATALNDAVTSKGATYSIDIIEDNKELYLILPTGAEYPISVEEGKLSVAGGEISEEAGGNFVYKDKMGGMWLVEKTE